MPGLSPIKILGNLKFLSSGLKLPTEKASGDAKGWSEKFFRDRDREPARRPASHNSIPPWFMPQKPGTSRTRRPATSRERRSRISTTR